MSEEYCVFSQRDGIMLVLQDFPGPVWSTARVEKESGGT